MTDAVVRSGRDSYTNEARPSENYADVKVLRLLAGTSVRKYGHLWVKNPAPDDPPANVTSAILRLYGKGAWGAGTVSVSIQRLSSTWKQSTLDWNNQPGVTGPVVTLTQANAADGTEWAFDLTAIFQSITNGTANYGFRITTTSTTERVFYSFQALDLTPHLDVAWSDAPDAPTTLHPSGGRAVGTSKPTVRFDYVDPSGGDELAAVRVQIKHGSSDFTTPTYDSGVAGVATSVPELDLSTTAYAGVGSGVVAYWRVMVKDAAGNWSKWSDPESFTFTAPMTLTLNNPAVSPNNFVTESTPPIFWTPGGTQTAWRLVIARDDDPTDYLYDSRRTPGTTTSKTLPKKVIVDQGATYRATIDSWDNVDREAVPGFPTYSRVVRAFTFREDATPNPVTGLTVTQPVADRPTVDVGFSRSTAPDSFTVVRDGQVVDSGLLPADLFVSGTAYKYRDRGADPNVEHTWKVQAVVNGKASTGNPTVLATPKTGLIWLFDPDSDDACPILGSLDQQYAAGEISGTLEPIEGKAVVRVVQTLRGLEGTVEGRTSTIAGTSGASAAANLRKWRRHPTKQLRLTLGNTNLLVEIGNVKVAPTTTYTRPDDRAVSFAFWSQDGA